MAVRQTDPLLSYQFAVEITGPVQVSGYFTEVGDLGDEFDVVEHKAVDVGGHELVQMIPGRGDPSRITLKKGITASMGLWDWRELVVQGDTATARTAMSVIMFDRNYEAIARWDFQNAWPSKISGPEIKADSNDFTVETLTIVFESMNRVL